jgi:endoglucanase
MRKQPIKILWIIAMFILLGCGSSRLFVPTIVLTSTFAYEPILTFTPTPTLTARPSEKPTSLRTLYFPYVGVNLAGAEFSDRKLPGNYNNDYIYPNSGEVDYFIEKGMTIFRLPFHWERLQQSQHAEFEIQEQMRMDEFVNYATSKGAYVLIDPHNFARYYGNIIGESKVPVSAYTDFWSKLASHYRENDKVIFGLMNEPNTMSTELWLSDANAAIQAIRATGATNLILVPGNAWSGAASWGQNWYGTPNAIAMLQIIDSGNNYAFETHAYLDSDGSGTVETCVSSTIGSERMSYFTSWLRKYNKRGFLGEFGGSTTDTCLKALDNMLSYLEKNSDVYLGWSYWAAGPWWNDYIFSVEPDENGDRPQMMVLSNHLP